MKKPVLWVQTHPSNKNRLLFDFCYSAKQGAEESNIKVKGFQTPNQIPSEPTNIVVGSVEMCYGWLSSNDYTLPEPISLARFPKPLLGREMELLDIKDVKFPTFIKPATGFKSFTGFEASNGLEVDIFSEGYKGLVWSQEIVDIVSEYRLYVHRNRIIGMKHYTGDYLVFPDGKFIQRCVDFSNNILDNISYTLDFGVLTDGTTILIEANDGWAIGNYGIEPYRYYHFLKDRWFQITGILK